MNEFLKAQKAKIIIIVAILLTAGFFLIDSFINKGGDEENTFQFENNTQSALILGENYQQFTHPQYTFSVEYPKELEVERFQEGDDSETIIFQESLSAGSEQEKIGFQIFISPFGKDEILTQNRILEDLPEAIIEEPQEAILGTLTGASEEERIHALLFWSHDPSIGKTREVWFTHDGYLYEITTYAYLDSWLAKILSTWNFNTL